MPSITPKASTAGLNKTLANHSEKLNLIITALKNYDPMAVNSLKEMIDKFMEAKEELSSKIGELTKQIQHSTDTASTAMANPASMSIGIKMIAGPIARLIIELKGAYDLIKMIVKIVTQYVTIFALVSAKIVEMALMVVALGLKFVKDALGNMLSELYIFLAAMKKKAVDYAKEQIKGMLVPGWEKDRATMQERLTALEKTPTSDNLKERTAIKAKIKSLTASITWVNSTFKPATVGV